MCIVQKKLISHSLTPAFTETLRTEENRRRRHFRLHFLDQYLVRFNLIPEEWICVCPSVECYRLAFLLRD